jgi:flagellar basal-body rod modification protein FlgD
MSAQQISSSTSSLYSTGALNTTTQQALGKQEFLQLLVTQLKNQDPLSPMESQEFASQLAEFTSVETLTSIDERLEENTNTDLLLMQSIQNTMAASFIGKEVTALSDDIYLEADKDATLRYKLGANADKVTVTISDANGKVVRTIVTGSVTSGENSLAWDGKNDSGEKLASGNFTYTVTAVDAEGDSVASLTFCKALITSVGYQSGTAVLVAGGVEIPFANVMQISAADEG